MLRGFWGTGFVIINSVHQTTRLIRSFHSALELGVAQNRIIILIFVLAVKYWKTVIEKAMHTLKNILSSQVIQSYSKLHRAHQLYLAKP